MTFTGLVLTGTSGSGKSTIAQSICARDPRFKIVKAVTTRPPREDDAAGAYEHLTIEEFQRWEKIGALLVSAQYLAWIIHEVSSQKRKDALKG